MTSPRLPPDPTRRALLRGGAAAGLAAALGAQPAQAGTWRDRIRLTAAMLGIGTPPLHDPALLVAGGASSACGRFAADIAPTFGAALPGTTTVAVDTTVGLDGVTGSNQFDALTSPDGNTALVAPGAAWIAWLAGDPRVHFDPSRWVPVMTATMPAVVAVRMQVTPGAPLRLAAASPVGPALPAWLGLSLLGAKVIPVAGLAEPDEVRRALREGRIDAALLSGADALAPPPDGTRRLFSLGSPTEDAKVDAPGLADALPPGAADGALFAAWRATAAATRLTSAVVLPALAPATAVAVWRRAGRHVSLASEAGPAPTPAPACLPDCSAMIAGDAAMLALRQWLIESAGWHPA